jgi:outer membrane receptor protein involved in Fe transport
MTPTSFARLGFAALCAVAAVLILAGRPAWCQEETQLTSIIVTAQKRSEQIDQVPISSMALSQSQMDLMGVKDVADIARLVPGVTLQGSDDVGNMNIAIRGIISTVGAATTGIYIDDVPVQVRQNSAVWGNPYPKIFDLDRVEVLRGPQGTLFGAGSEGGAIRFITPEASLHRLSATASADLATTQGGAPSAEAGAAIGGPIQEGRLGYRASVWRREDGGYAARVDPVTGRTLARNGNWTSSTVARLGLNLVATENLTITPAVLYQRTRDGDKGLLYESAGTYDQRSSIASPHDDRFVLSSLGVDQDFGSFGVKSVTAYMDRKVDEVYDSTGYELTSLAGSLTVPFDPAYLVTAFYHSAQRAFSQEFRLTSVDAPGARLSWVGGLFYQRSIADYDPLYQDLNIDALANYLSQGAGSGPADSASYFGEAPIAGRYSYVDHFTAIETDLSAFGDATFAPTPALKLAIGLRLSRSGFSYADHQDGPWGPTAPYYQAGAQSQKPVTPRVNATYQVDPTRMVYASIAKGYRIGGANEPLPASCNQDLATLGLANTPSTYRSDSLWSYEAGLKGRFLDNTVLLETSAFWINWSQIQQSIYLTNCGYNFVGNLGRAVSRGVDVQAEWTATPRLILSATTGLTDARFAQTVLQDAQVLARQGDRLATPAVTATAGIEYRFLSWQHANGYARLDGQFSSAYFRSGSDGTFGSDPLLRNAPAVKLASVRVGERAGAWDVSAYINNLFDASTSLYRTRSTSATLDLRDERLRPRTVGISAKYTFR